MKNVPQRMCISCREKKDKKKLMRIVCNKNGEINVDINGKHEGRGAYICKDINCLEKAIKTNSLERAIKTKINKDFYNKLRGVIIE